MRPVLIVGGAPRVRVDAVRFLQARASGATAVALGAALAARGVANELLLALDAAPGAPALRYDDRPALDAALATWIAAHADGVVVMSAAVNDYDVGAVEADDGRSWRAGDKVPSGCAELVVRLRPAAKLIDQLGPRFGLRGPLVGFKYEDAATVLASARALRERVGAALVVANSIDGSVQALIDASGSERCASRDALLGRLAARVAALAGG